MVLGSATSADGDEALRFLIPEAISWRDVPGEIVLFDARANAYHALNLSAAQVWRALAQGLSPQKTAMLLSARFGRDTKEMAGDVTEFINRALEQGLLLRAGGPP